MQRVDYQKLLIQDILNFYKSGELNLNPWYQRRSVWTRPQKSYLIDSIYKQMPVPTIYIRHSLDLATEKSIKEVVDGQQRIRAIIEFCDSEFTAKIGGNRLKYQDMSSNARSKLLMTSLSVGVLIEADDTDVIEIFGRVNSVAKTLNSQENRNSKFSGEYKQFCLSEAARRVQLWRDLSIFTANDIARMNEVQFVSDVVLNMIEGLTDFSQARLNKIYDKYEEDFKIESRIEKRMDRIFKCISSMPIESIRDTIFSRQPIFFSLFLILDSMKKLPTPRKLSDVLYSIDDAFNSDTPVSDRSNKDAEFHAACTSSTQRIKSRIIRDKYIRGYLGK